MGDVERAGGTWDGNVNHHVALLQYFLADTVALVADDEGGVSGKLGVVNICGVGCCFDGDNFFICRDDFTQIGFLGEVPFNIISARCGAFSHSSEAVCRLNTEKYHLRGTNVV